MISYCVCYQSVPKSKLKLVKSNFYPTQNIFKNNNYKTGWYREMHIAVAVDASLGCNAKNVNKSLNKKEVTNIRWNSSNLKRISIF